MKPTNTEDTITQEITLEKEVAQDIAQGTQEKNAQKESPTQVGDRQEESTKVGDKVGDTKKEIAQVGDKQMGEIAQTEITQEKVTHNENAQGKVLKNRMVQSKIADKLKKYKKKDEIAQAIEEAFKYKQQHKELPSKRKLMSLAGCTDNSARQALKIIDEVTEEMSQTR